MRPAAWSLAFLACAASTAFAQDDERTRRIYDRIEKEIRESQARLREDLKALIREEIQKSRAPGKADPPAPAARKKVYLGIVADDQNDEDRKALGAAGGIKVAEAKGPAQKAGFLPGDLVLSLGGHALSEDSVGEVLAKFQPGDEVEAVLLRKGKRLAVRITLAERKD